MFFFLVFGTLILRIFGVPLSMVRIVGGIILMRIGFELFSPSAGGSMVDLPAERAPAMTTSPSSRWPCRSCSGPAPSPRS